MNELASLGLILLFALLVVHLVKFARVPEVTGLTRSQDVRRSPVSSPVLLPTLRSRALHQASRGYGGTPLVFS